MTWILTILLSTASAGPVKTFCERYLIADDPYQYETASDAFVIDEYLRIGERVAAGSDEASRLWIMGNEIRLRKLHSLRSKIAIQMYEKYEVNPGWLRTPGQT